MMRKLIILLCFSVLLFLTSGEAYAQVWDNKFDCEWTGIECVVKTPVFPHGCAPGFDADRSVCESIDDSWDCQGQVNNSCVEIYPDSCYECVSVAEGCYPRDCDDPRAEYPDWDSCDDACTGKVPIKFRCDNGQCVEDENGPYKNLQSCLLDCSAPPPPPPDGGCDDPKAIRTAIGCINVSGPTGFVSSILSLAVGIGGGIAFLLIIFGAFQILTSSGTPEKVQAGKELITSAIAGLLLIIFAVFILRLIGAEILKIPGFE